MAQVDRLPNPASRSAAALTRVTAPQLGMIVLLISLTMLFGASIVMYAITRSQNADWAPAGAKLPVGLLVSTGAIALTSFCLQAALGAVRSNRFERSWRLLVGGTIGALLFLVMQSANWTAVRASEQLLPSPTLYGFTFYMLTGLHAAHVLGGFVPLAIVMQRLAQRQYSSSRHQGFGLCVLYWHYLGAVWLVLLGSLYLFT